jgi:hypothetical protein
MINFTTLNVLISDLLNTIRASKISRSESISKRQIESWIHFYRGILLKQDLDKGKMPNPDYIQELPGLQLEVVDKSEGMNLPSNTYWLRTKLVLPKTIDLNFKPGFTYVGTVDGREIQLVSEGRATWQQHKKYTSRDNIAFLRGGRLYLVTVTPIEFISPRGVFEVPTEVSNFQNTNADFTYSNLDSPYPIPINMVPVLKEMILKKELGIMVQAPSDITNDSADLVQPNTIKQ